MGLNQYRDEAKRFMEEINAQDENISILFSMFGEEFSILKETSLDSMEEFNHQVYDMLFILFEIAAKFELDLDAEWGKGKKHKEKKYCTNRENKVVKYNKLVRDKIPEICNQDGKDVIIKELSNKEYEKCLCEKLIEECEEYIESRDIEELADAMEVVYAIAANKDVNYLDIESLRQKKREKRGGFDKKILLIETRER